MKRLYLRRNFFYNLVRLVVALLGAHLVLWIGEPEGYFEIIFESGFLHQFLFHTVALFSLSICIGSMLSYRRPMMSKLKSDPKIWMILLLKAFVIPLVLILIFANIYFRFFDLSFSLFNYAKVILPVVILVVIIFVALEILYYAIYVIRVLVRGFKIRSIRDHINISKNTVVIKSVSIHTWTTVTVRPNEIEPTDFLEAEVLNEYDELLKLKVFVMFDVHNRRVYAYDKFADRHKLEYRYLKSVKEHLKEDKNFFITGSWIIRIDFIDRLEKRANQGLAIFIKLPSLGFLTLNKNDVKKFNEWYSIAKRQEEDHSQM